MKTKNTYQKLFSPKSVAIVGASDKEGKVGTVIAQNILNLGYEGKVYFVNQSYETLYGQRCYQTLQSINKPIDVAIVAVPAKFVLDVIADSAKKIKNFVIISAGFGETNEEGKKREAALAELAKLFDLNILGPNCLGFISPSLKLNASFAGGMPAEGNISFVSQSGALAVSLMDIANEKHLGFSSIISVGNKMQIDEAGLLEHFAQDKDTKVIAMYLEGIKDGQSFIKMAERVSKIKPIVILKAGKSKKSQQAISSHTGALAGSDSIMDVAFEKAGVIRAEDLEQFFDLISLISQFPAPLTDKVAVITNAGGAGVLATDSFEKKTIKLADFSDLQKKEILKDLPEEASAHNPVDVLGDAQEDRYEKVLKTLERDKTIGTILNILTPQDQTPVDAVAEVIVKARKRSKKIIIASFIGGERVSLASQTLRHFGVPNFSFPERAVGALNAYSVWGENRNSRNIGHESIKINLKRREAIRHIISRAQSEKRSALYYGEAAQAMGFYGVPSVSSHAIIPGHKMPAKVSYPAVLKVDSDKVLHKSDKQALVVGIGNQKELKAAVLSLQGNFPGERLVLQSMQDKQIEIILGIKNDDIFGPVIVYGLGGIYTEIFKKVNFLIPPMSSGEIEESLKSGELGFLFKETRGQKPYDIKEMVRIINGLFSFAKENPQVKEFDINPMFLYNDNRKACAVDIKIIF